MFRRSSRLSEVHELLDGWQQGDVFDFPSFYYLRNPKLRTTDASSIRRRGKNRVVEERVDTGKFVLITQTCDIVPRRGRSRDRAVVSPVVMLSEGEARAAWKGDRPQYAPLGVPGESWFADLSRLMTVETGVFAQLARITGLSGDRQKRKFAYAVARRFSRYAFPDELERALKPFTERVRQRHHKDESPEGRALHLIRQIRIVADPDWSADRLAVELFFIYGVGALPYSASLTGESDETVAELAEEYGGQPSAQLAEELSATMAGDPPDWSSIDPLRTYAVLHALVQAWIDSCQPNAKIVELTATLEDERSFSVAQSWRTERLDLDYLSGPDKSLT